MTCAYLPLSYIEGQLIKLQQKQKHMKCASKFEQLIKKKKTQISNFICEPAISDELISS